MILQDVTNQKHLEKVVRSLYPNRDIIHKKNNNKKKREEKKERKVIVARY
jgi:hypothetical protein